MKKIRLGTNFAVFLIFFGLSLFEALHAGNWLSAVLWMAIGIFFLLANNVSK